MQSKAFNNVQNNKNKRSQFADLHLARFDQLKIVIKTVLMNALGVYRDL